MELYSDEIQSKLTMRERLLLFYYYARFDFGSIDIVFCMYNFSFTSYILMYY